MIEIIREEDWDSETREKTLPKDIKQIGKPDIGDRIYIENQIYTYLHPYESLTEKTAYVLLGRFENYAGKQCTFVEGAIQLEEMSFDGELPRWNDQTWSYIYKQLKNDYDSMVIVGWAMDMKGQLPNMTARIEALHQNHFGGIHQILFLLDTLEQEEAFYSCRNNHLYRRDGFYIYYDKSIPARMNKAIADIEEKKENLSGFEEIYIAKEEIKQEEQQVQESKPVEPQSREEKQQGIYRQLLAKQEEQRVPAYSSSLLLLVVVCVLGVAAYRNYQKVNEMEYTLAQLNTAKVIAETESAANEKASGVKVEEVQGEIIKEEVASDLSQVEIGNETGVDLAQVNATEISPSTEPDTTIETNAAVGPDTETEIPKVQDTLTETEANSETATETALTTVASEGQVYLKQGYYIVQKGDNLAGICRKIYQTTAMMDKVCEANEIDDPDAIYAGQYLTLPN